LDCRQVGGAEAIDELDLVGRRDRRVLVLQTVARTHFNDGDASAAKGCNVNRVQHAGGDLTKQDLSASSRVALDRRHDSAQLRRWPRPERVSGAPFSSLPE